MILTDGVHLASDESIEELHRFARLMGLKRHYFQGTRRGHPHYDLTTVKMTRRAVTMGAERVPPRMLAARMVRT